MLDSPSVFFLLLGLHVESIFVVISASWWSLLRYLLRYGDAVAATGVVMVVAVVPVLVLVLVLAVL